MQKIVAEEEDQIARLTRDLAEAQTERERVQSRIKALLERLEAIEEQEAVRAMRFQLGLRGSGRPT